MILSPDIPHLFSYLEGNWELRREIPENHASMVGSAQFRRAASRNLLDYREDGRLYLRPGNEETVHNSYRSYRYECEPDTLLVYFADGPDIGKEFLRLTYLEPKDSPEVITLVGKHICLDDTYETTYRFRDTTHFEVVHRVQGPKKHYTSSTSYDRLPILDILQP